MSDNNENETAMGPEGTSAWPAEQSLQGAEGAEGRNEATPQESRQQCQGCKLRDEFIRTLLSGLDLAFGETRFEDIASGILDPHPNLRGGLLRSADQAALRLRDRRREARARALADEELSAKFVYDTSEPGNRRLTSVEWLNPYGEAVLIEDLQGLSLPDELPAAHRGPIPRGGIIVPLARAATGPLLREERPAEMRSGPPAGAERPPVRKDVATISPDAEEVKIDDHGRVHLPPPSREEGGSDLHPAEVAARPPSSLREAEAVEAVEVGAAAQPSEPDHTLGDDLARELAEALTLPSTLPNLRRVQLLRMQLRKLKHPAANMGLLRGGSSELSTEEQRERGPSRVTAESAVLRDYARLFSISHTATDGTKVGLCSAFAGSLPRDVEIRNGTYVSHYRVGPQHYWGGQEYQGVPVWYAPKTLLVAPTASARPQVPITFSGVYASAMASMEGSRTITEVSTNLRLDLTQINGNTEMLHASMLSARLRDANAPSMVEVLFRALNAISASSPLDYCTADLVAESVKIISPTDNHVGLSGPAPYSGIVTTLVPCRAITMTTLVDLYSGRIQGPAGFTIDDVKRGTVAVVPIRSSWLTEAAGNTAWVAAHVEYPWRVVATEETIWLGSGNLVTPHFTMNHFVHVPGPTSVLLVLTDVLGRETGEYSVVLGDATFTGGVTVTVSTVANGFGGAANNADIMPALDTAVVGWRSADNAWLRVVQRWAEVGGNRFDWETAWVSVLECSGVISSMSLGSTVPTSSFFTYSLAPSYHPSFQITGRSSFTVTNLSIHGGTSMAGQIVEFHAIQDFDDPGVLADGERHWLSIPQVDPLVWTGLAARFYHVQEPMDVGWTVHDLQLSLARALPLGYALADRMLWHAGMSARSVFYGRSLDAVADGNWLAYRDGVHDLIKTAFRGVHGGESNAFTPMWPSEAFPPGASSDHAWTRDDVGPGRVDPRWAESGVRLKHRWYDLSKYEYEEVAIVGAGPRWVISGLPGIPRASEDDVRELSRAVVARQMFGEGFGTGPGVMEVVRDKVGSNPAVIRAFVTLPEAAAPWVTWNMFSGSIEELAKVAMAVGPGWPLLDWRSLGPSYLSTTQETGLVRISDELPVDGLETGEAVTARPAGSGVPPLTEVLRSFRL